MDGPKSKFFEILTKIAIFQFFFTKIEILVNFEKIEIIENID